MPTAPLRSSGVSARSAVESGSLSHRGGSVVQSSFLSSHSRNTRSKSLCQADLETLPLSVPPPGTLRRSLSGTLAQDRGLFQQEAELPSQYTYKGPSHRTISRITNRQQHSQQQGAAFGQEGWGGTGRGVPTAGDGWGTQWQQHVSRANHVSGNGLYLAPIRRTASTHSVRSVGRGVDILDGASIHSNDPLEE